MISEGKKSKTRYQKGKDPTGNAYLIEEPDETQRFNDWEDEMRQYD
jgi:hypothetical protein